MNEKVLINFCNIRVSWGIDPDNTAEEMRMSRGLFETRKGAFLPQYSRRSTVVNVEITV